MAKAVLRRGQGQKAVSEFRTALQLDPEDIQSLVYLARILAADNDAQVRNGAEAVRLAQRANALTGNSQTFILDTLAMAYAEAGRFGEAEQTVQLALDRAAATDDPGAVPVMQSRLKLYQAGKPYREDFSLPTQEAGRATK
jgi:spermidine synthase